MLLDTLIYTNLLQIKSSIDTEPPSLTLYAVKTLICAVREIWLTSANWSSFFSGNFVSFPARFCLFQLAIQYSKSLLYSRVFLKLVIYESGKIEILWREGTSLDASCLLRLFVERLWFNFFSRGFCWYDFDLVSLWSYCMILTFV